MRTENSAKQIRLRLILGAAIFTICLAAIYLSKHNEKTRIATFEAVLREAEKGRIDVRWVFATCMTKTGSTEEELLDWLLLVANNGNDTAQVVIAGYFYSSGNNLIGLSWLARAAHAGNHIAEVSVGAAYRDNVILKPDSAKAIEWYEKAAHGGNAHAQFLLGEMYLEGDGVLPDKEMGLRWMEMASAGGHAEAKRWLAKHGALNKVPSPAGK